MDALVLRAGPSVGDAGLSNFLPLSYGAAGFEVKVGESNPWFKLVCLGRRQGYLVIRKPKRWQNTQRDPTLYPQKPWLSLP